VRVEVGVGLPQKPIGKPKTLCEVGEMGVYKQVGKLGRRLEERSRGRTKLPQTKP
jgi:hypothetical protein